MSSQRERFLIDILGKYVRIPYIWGGDSTEKGLDCSGLVQLLLEKFDLDPPGDQTADSLYRHFKPIGKIKPFGSEDLGDIVFFGTENKVTHIAMCLGFGLMLEAGGGGHTTTTIQKAKEQNAMVRVAPINRRSDRVIILRISESLFF